MPKQLHKISFEGEFYIFLYTIIWSYL